MAQFNFEGDIAGLSDRQLEFVNKVVSEQYLKVNKVVFEPLGKTGDNFMSNVKRISIEGEDGNLKMVVKIAPKEEVIRASTHTQVMFTNEHIMYKEVLPKFVSLQKAAGVPAEERLRYAKCYGSLNEAPDEMILLEDLNELDFTMLNKYESLSNECVKSILKNFATLHSLSYALRHKEPAVYEQFKNKLTNTWPLMPQSPVFAMQIQHVEMAVLSLLDDETHKSLIKGKFEGMFKLMTKLAKEEDGKHFVIQQGDGWTNNVMFRFQGDNLMQSIMIDYQGSGNNRPVFDLLYMIFNCTDHETRSKNFYDWLQYYHTELDRSLSNFGLKANYFYPMDQLDVDLKRYGRSVFGLCLMLSNILMRDSKEAGVIMEALKSGGIEKTMEAFSSHSLQSESVVRGKKRIVGLIESFTQFGLL
ncbi:unnamed protein product [Spodoptera littoralis]|uniref:CHK kinase-like domain-containing protein n=1 Tax=Spodoptera littoralis TaxID=7109 RepID=A0A9P0HVN5_SPOLI|nr:unnamed protein product [Spodoptera littoralis]CAH1634842.1 unnamed protein product [Spodoptera littoralis]